MRLPMIALHPPNLLARPFIHGGNEGDVRSAVFHVTLQKKEIFVKRRRRARPHSHLGDFAYAGLPDQLAVEVITIKPFGLEERVNKFAVSDRRARSVTVLAVAVVEYRPFEGDALP